MPGENVAVEVTSMPGVYNLSVERCADEAARVADLGIPSAVSPTSASRSGIEVGATPCLAITAASSSVTSFQRSQHTTR